MLSSVMLNAANFRDSENEVGPRSRNKAECAKGCCLLSRLNSSQLNCSAEDVHGCVLYYELSIFVCQKVRLGFLNVGSGIATGPSQCYYYIYCATVCYVPLDEDQHTLPSALV